MCLLGKRGSFFFKFAINAIESKLLYMWKFFNHKLGECKNFQFESIRNIGIFHSKYNFVDLKLSLSWNLFDAFLYFHFLSLQCTTVLLLYFISYTCQNEGPLPKSQLFSLLWFRDSVTIKWFDSFWCILCNFLC